MANETRPEYYRHRAESVRVLAAKLRDQAARQGWLEIAERYDALANMAEWGRRRRSFCG
jgi:hypothetical protein